MLAAGTVGSGPGAGPRAAGSDQKAPLSGWALRKAVPPCPELPPACPPSLSLCPQLWLEGRAEQTLWVTGRGRNTLTHSALSLLKPQAAQTTWSRVTVTCCDGRRSRTIVSFHRRQEQEETHGRCQLRRERRDRFLTESTAQPTVGVP